MVKQFLDYKEKIVKQRLLDSALTSKEKQSITKEYDRWIKEIIKDGSIVINEETAHEIMQFINEQNLPITFDKYDRYVIGEQKDKARKTNPFQSIDDIIAIHKSPILPINNTILTQENSGLTNQIVFVYPFSGEKHSVPYVVGNDTIHFTLNCAVENHEVGNDWDSYPYAVAIKLSNLDKTKILDTKSEDTYMEGNVDLGNEYYIFCPLGERENVQKNNTNATIVEYDGITLNEAIKAMIIYSGKKVEQYGTYGWERDDDYLPQTIDSMILKDLIKKEGYPYLENARGPLLHSETEYMARRMWKREYRALIALSEYNKQNNIDMSFGIMLMALQLGGAYSLPGTVPVSVQSYKECVIPILNEHGYEVDDNLFLDINPNEEGYKNITSTLIPRYGKVPNITSPSWENTLRERVIELVQSKEIEHCDVNNLVKSKNNKK